MGNQSLARRSRLRQGSLLPAFQLRFLSRRGAPDRDPLLLPKKPEKTKQRTFPLARLDFWWDAPWWEGSVGRNEAQHVARAASCKLADEGADCNALLRAVKLVAGRPRGYGAIMRPRAHRLFSVI